MTLCIADWKMVKLKARLKVAKGKLETAELRRWRSFELLRPRKDYK